MALREPTSSELKLIKFLFFKAGDAECLEKHLEHLKVSPMDDGEMGSLRLFPFVVENPSSRFFGKAVSECYFDDTDGVRVIVTLNLDQNGNPFEIDVWKTNYGKLIKIPDIFDTEE